MNIPVAVLLAVFTLIATRNFLRLRLGIWPCGPTCFEVGTNHPASIATASSP